MKAIVKTFHLLSFNVVAGSCICSVFIARILNSSISYLSIISLGITVWIIYTFDHYNDGKKIRCRGKDRHAFHQVHSGFIRTSVFLCISINAVIMVFLPAKVLGLGLGLLAVVIIYFIILKELNRVAAVIKELLIAFIFSAGIFIPAVGAINQPLGATAGVLYGLFFLLAWINLLLFSWFDFEYDKKAGFPSLVGLIGKNLSRKLILLLLMFYYILWILVFKPTSVLVFPEELGWITFIMGIILSVIIINPKTFSVDERYRLIGDGIFLIPLMTFIL